MNQFLQDVLTGLTAKEKYLQSKYFYNANGDKLFQKIMGSQDYYLTRCELEIFTQQSKEIIDTITPQVEAFDVIELGAGDVTKSIHLLAGLVDNNARFTYYPVDISANVIELLQEKIPEQLPAIKICGLNGEYLQMLKKARELSGKHKIVLFLGANIGNVPLEQAAEFCKSLKSDLRPGDHVLIGFDLRKDPFVIFNAYNDREGLTRQFNLNLLSRINEELGANFILENFRHYANYDPGTGSCKSYLVSTTKQQVHLDGSVIYFDEGETIFMEISQKYTIEQTDNLARDSGFIPVKHFLDTKGWFLDVVWKVF